MIWFKHYTYEEVNDWCKDTLVSHLDIEITKVEDDSLEGVMSISNKHHQPMRLVHGGANCVLAETLGSLAGNMVLDRSKSYAVGLSIHTSHLKAVRSGAIRGVAKPVSIGKTIHVWEILTYNDAQVVTSKTSLTLAIRNMKS